MPAASCAPRDRSTSSTHWRSTRSLHSRVVLRTPSFGQRSCGARGVMRTARPLDELNPLEIDSVVAQSSGVAHSLVRPEELRCPRRHTHRATAR